MVGTRSEELNTLSPRRRDKGYQGEREAPGNGLFGNRWSRRKDVECSGKKARRLEGGGCEEGGSGQAPSTLC